MLLLTLSSTVFAQADTLCGKKTYATINLIYGTTYNAFNASYAADLTAGQNMVTTQNMINSKYKVGMGSWSAWLVPPKPPTLVASQGDFKDRIRLSWEADPLSPRPTGYVIYRDGSVIPSASNLDEDVTEFTDFFVQAGEFYQYSIAAKNAFGTGSTNKFVGFVYPNGVVSGKIETNSGNPVPGVEVRLTPLTGNSMAFNGVDGQLCVSYNTKFPTAAFTVSAYVKLGTNTNDEAGIIDWGSTLNKNWWITTLPAAEGKGYIFHIGNGTDSDTLKYHIPVNSSNLLGNDEKWHQITMMYNGATMSILVDGNFVGTKAASIAAEQKQRMTIGSKINNAYFKGLIDDVRIYDRTLTQTEINATKNRAISSTENGLVAYWKMDEGLGVKTFDITETPATANIYGGAAFSADKPEVYNAGVSDVTGYYLIDGVNYSTAESFRATPSKNFEYNTALEFTAAEKSYGNLTDFNIPDSATVEILFHPFDLKSRQTVYSKQNLFELYINDSELFLDLNGTITNLGAIAAKYYRLSILMNKTTGTAEVYMNGNSLTSISFAGNPFWENGKPWVVATNDTTVAGNFYTGLIDEIAIFKKFLTVPEIQLHSTIAIPDDSTRANLFSYFDFNEGTDTEVYDYFSVNADRGEPRIGHIRNATWSNNVKLRKTEPHEFQPNVRVVNLNNSNTAIGNIDFRDVSTVNLAGTVRFANTFCFVDQVEILVNGQSHLPAIKTDINGRWSADFEPGANVALTPVYKDHTFSPARIEYRKLQAPKAGIVFLDNVKRSISGQVAGGLCKKSIIPDDGSVVIKVATLDGCFEKIDTIRVADGKYSFTDLPARAFSVTVEYHSVGPIFDQLKLKGSQVDLRDSVSGVVDFIYFASPEIQLQPFPLATCSGSTVTTPMIVQSQSESTPKYKKEIRVYEQYGFTDALSDRCYLDNAVLTINNAIQGSAQEVIQMESDVYVYEFYAGVPNIIAPYTKVLDIRANVNGGSTTITDEAIVLGRRSRETTFTTLAPSDKPLWILRDPPGDASFSTLESGSTKCEVYGNAFTNTTEGSLAGSVEIGKKVTTFVGAGFGVVAGVIEENGVVTTLGMTGSINYQGSTNSETEVCYTTTNAYSTSEGDDIVGRMADVFIGTSMNFEYGVNDVLYFDQATCQIADTVSVFVDPKRFGTEYVYSRFQIINDVIPSLELLQSQNPTSSEDYGGQVARWKKILNEDEYYLKPKQVAPTAISQLVNGVLDILPFSSVIPSGIVSTATKLIETSVNLNTPGVQFFAGTATSPDTIRYAPVFDKNVTFDGLTNFTSTFSEAEKRTSTTTWAFGADFKTSLETEITVFTIDIGTNIEMTTGSNTESTAANSSEKTTTISYTLADNDVGDNFTVDISKKGDMPVFGLKAGESSCPWEYGTLNIEEVGVRADRLSQVNVPANVLATFPIHLQNIGQTGGDPMVVLIGTVPTSNPNGAKISINGANLTQPLTFQIDAESELDLLLTIEKGPIDFNYEDLKIFLTTECQYQHSLSLGYLLSDGLGYLIDETGILPGFDASKYDNLNEKFYKELSFDVSFIEPCSEVDISFPQQNFVVNPAINNQLSITVDEYNKDDADLEKISMFYRPDGAASWIKFDEVLKNDLGELFETVTWNTSLLKDGIYDIKAVTQCTDVSLNPGESTVIRGKLERNPPEVVGVPQPADGIWNPGNEISITFNEDIDCDKLIAADVLGNNTIGLYDATTNALVAATFSCVGNRIIIVPTINPKDFENRTFRVQISGKEYDDAKIASNPGYIRGALRDKAGNMIPTSITWEFAVNQNDLEWVGTDIIEANTVLNPFSVKRQIRNRGGTITSFRMENIPSWLTVSPATGTLNSGQSADITFTFQTDLLIGDYESTVNLVGSKGAEPLGIDYRVRCEAPSFAVDNPAQYEGSMNMVIDLNIFGIKSTDPSDIIVAKIDGQIRGVGHVQYFRNLPEANPLPNPYVDTRWRTFLTIYADVADVGKPIEFNVWDGDKCNSYIEVLEQFTYQEGALVGSPLEPQPLSVLDLVEKCISLNRGFNWVSFNLDLGAGNNTFTNALASLQTKTDAYIKTDNNFATYLSGTNDWDALSPVVLPTKRYMLYVPGKDTVCIKGSPYKQAEQPITIRNGWNWLGYVPSTGMTVTQALAGLTPLNGDLIKSQTLFAQYVAGVGWIGNLNFLEPQKGYLLKISTAGTLTYPSTNVSTSGFITSSFESVSTMVAMTNQRLIEPEMTFDFAQYNSTMNLIGQVNGIAIAAADELRAYIDGKLVGRIKPTIANKSSLFFQTIYQDESRNVHFRLFKADRGKEFDLNRTVQYQAETLAGSVSAPIVFEIQTSNQDPVPVTITIADQLIRVPSQTFTTVSLPNSVVQTTANCKFYAFNTILPIGTETKPVCGAETFQGSMTTVIKINYSELSSFVSANDVLSFVNPITGVVLGCAVFNSTSNLFYATIGGPTTSTPIPIDMVYYSDVMKKSLTIRSVFNYVNNTRPNNGGNPFVVDVSPLQINKNGNNEIVATLRDPDWTGEYCMNVFAMNCAGYNDGQTSFCLQRLGINDCLDLIVRSATESTNTSLQALKISSESVINNGIRLEYIGGKTIELKPGFETKIGTVFIGKIEGCDNK